MARINLSNYHQKVHSIRPSLPSNRRDTTPHDGIRPIPCLHVPDMDEDLYLIWLVAYDRPTAACGGSLQPFCSFGCTWLISFRTYYAAWTPDAVDLATPLEVKQNNVSII